jgi:hypothetical protein
MYVSIIHMYIYNSMYINTLYDLVRPPIPYITSYTFICIYTIGPSGRLVLKGQKYAYCMEDTERYFPGGKTVGCQQKYDCAIQGIQKGWIDSYGTKSQTSPKKNTNSLVYVLYIDCHFREYFSEGLDRCRRHTH